MATNLDKLFQRLDNYNLGTDEPQQIEIAAVLSDTTATLTINAPDEISQFDSIEIVLTASGGASGGKAVSFDCSLPDWTDDDYEFSFHLVPTLGTPGEYKLNLSRALREANNGKPFAVSSTSYTLTYRISVIDSEGTEYTSSDYTISLCQTNLGEVSEDDLDRAFRFLNQIEGGD